MAQNIRIIKYPFSHGAGLNRSFSSPDIVHKITAPLLTKHVKKWQSLPALTKPPSKRRYKNLRNLSAVKEAVSKLGNQIAEALWQNQKPLTLGGDHTQGIATLKATALILTARAIINGDIPCKDKTLIERLQKLGNEGDFKALAKLISKNFTHKTLKGFTDTIAVIWLDSHADYNTRHTSKSGGIHGMSLAACTGHDIGGIENLFAGDVIKLNPKNLYILCARDIDADERKLMNKDGVNYKDWEMTTLGNLRSHDDPKHPTTLKKALNQVLKKLKDKHIILSMDVDAIHAGLHKSPYGIESVAATGTPMGIKAEEVDEILTKDAENFRRLNAHLQSPAGPTAGDTFEALQGIMNNPNIIAADLSEISPAAGNQGEPISEKYRGLTLETSMKILASMLGADLKTFTKALDKKIPELEKLVKAANRSERQQIKKPA